MKAMIFAAGVASRLKPLSLHTPKALVRLGDKTMLEIVAEKLVKFGVKTIVINVHHHHKQMTEFIAKLSYPGVEIIVSDESDKLLDTGGGLTKAKDFLEGNDPVIIHNVDVLSDVDLNSMVKFHKRNKALATLAVSKRKTTRYFKCRANRLTGWINTSTKEEINCFDNQQAKNELLAFSGIHVISPDIFSHINENGTFSLTKVYLRLAANNPIFCFEHDSHNWADIGTPEKLKMAQELYFNNPLAFK